ncbi:MAG: hypothetical protein AAGF79_06390 [Pseudomonadota bacterium]
METMVRGLAEPGFQIARPTTPLRLGILKKKEAGASGRNTGLATLINGYDEGL